MVTQLRFIRYIKKKAQTLHFSVLRLLGRLSFKVITDTEMFYQI